MHFNHEPPLSTLSIIDIFFNEMCILEEIWKMYSVASGHFTFFYYFVGNFKKN